jgi:hypothetical protein
LLGFRLFFYTKDFDGFATNQRRVVKKCTNFAKFLPVLVDASKFLSLAFLCRNWCAAIISNHSSNAPSWPNAPRPLPQTIHPHSAGIPTSRQHIVSSMNKCRLSTRELFRDVGERTHQTLSSEGRSTRKTSSTGATAEIFYSVAPPGCPAVRADATFLSRSLIRPLIS